MKFFKAVISQNTFGGLLHTGYKHAALKVPKNAINSIEKTVSSSILPVGSALNMFSKKLF